MVNGVGGVAREVVVVLVQELRQIANWPKERSAGHKDEDCQQSLWPLRHPATIAYLGKLDGDREATKTNAVHLGMSGSGVSGILVLDEGVSTGERAYLSVTERS